MRARFKFVYNHLSTDLAEILLKCSQIAAFQKGVGDFVISTWLKSYGLVC